VRVGRLFEHVHVGVLGTDRAQTIFARLGGVGKLPKPTSGGGFSTLADVYAAVGSEK
jgi:hypothetical protein